MIAGVMMVLLRDWHRPFGITNSINPFAGMVSMVPNVFPVVIIFGWMGHRGVKIDIGTMMCASVAMGVAVDDTIHFLTWFRIGMRNGLSRNDAILESYRRVATAMTQTTLIGGLGLAVFALSTFTPTQRFGVMMVTLLAAALVGDLVLLPALLAGPLGRFFVVSEKKTTNRPVTDDQTSEEETPNRTAEGRGETRHSAAIRSSGGVHRSDQNHNWPRP
jgi:multidrug efflux pump subunit AcrB